MTDTILTEIHDGYRVLTINRPDKMNALDRPTVTRLAECLKEAENDETCRALVLTGAGRGFCAGLDLQGYGAAPENDGEDALSLIHI